MRSLTAVCLFLSLAAPAAAQEKVARVGWLDWQSSGPYAEQTSKGFLQGLREGGFVEGKNLDVVRGSAGGEWRRFSELARVMAAAKVDVFFTPGKASADAAWYASRSTPTVIATINDPVALGYVKSLARPGMQVTGVMTSSADLTGKRLQMLAEIVPGLKRVGVLIDDAILTTCRQEMKQMDAAAEKLGISLIRVSAGNKDELNAAFKRLVDAKAQALMTTMMTTRHGMEADVIELAERHRLPAMYA
ncbi:MAG: ABC transporter substrate-binding protein, partial [Dongiaceae bacterium]